MLTISNNLVAKYPELKPLFNGINPNDILKINTNDLDKLLTNKQFDWKNQKFGLASFDAKQAPYSVTDWYYLAANLTLDFTCLDENAKVNTSTISQSYDMYFANDGSNLDQVVNVITTNIEEKIKAIKSVNVEYEKWNDSFVNQQQDVLNKINKQLESNSELSTIKGLEIKTQYIDNPYNDDYNYMSAIPDKKNHSLHLIDSKKYITNSKSFQSGWSSVIADRETNFVNRLNTWKTNNNLTITNLDNIFVFDDYKTTNWKISGLEIKSLTVPYYITGKDTTRASNTTESLAILEKLFVGDNALFKYWKNCDNGYNVTTLRFFLKPDAYDDFRERNVTVQTIDFLQNYDYYHSFARSIIYK